MSTIKEKLRQQEAAFISIDEALLSMVFSDWESTIRDVATFLCQTVPMHDSQMFLSRRENGSFRDASLDEVLPLIDFIASTGNFLTELAYGHESPVKSTGYETYGFRRSEFVRFMALHGVFFDAGHEQIKDENGAMLDRLSLLEAENARLLEQVAVLQQQLQADTAARQNDVEKPLHPKSEATYLNTIGALVELIQSPRPGRDSEAAVIRELLENYSDRPGIGKRTLETKFSMAKKSLKSD